MFILLNMIFLIFIIDMLFNIFVKFLYVYLDKFLKWLCLFFLLVLFYNEENIMFYSLYLVGI